MSHNKQRSFFTVVKNKYSDDIEKAVSQYIDDNWQQLDLQSSHVKTPDEAYLGNLHFHRLIPYEVPWNMVEFDVIVSAEIEIFETSHSQAVEGEDEKWFRVSCAVELHNGLNNFQIVDIDLYDSRENKPHRRLTDTLVPIISTTQLESVAESILKQYYPEALATPTQVDVRQFAARMGLTVKEAHLSKSGTIFGLMIFNNCTVEYYDIDTRQFDIVAVEEKTIIVDPEVYFLRTLGSWNNTVVHECVHWIKHRKVLELEHLYSDEVRMIRCQSMSKEQPDEKKRSDTEWMEWHANALAPRIQMPRKPYKEKADTLVAQYMQNCQTNNVTDVLPSVIKELAGFFGVSVQSAKIRMIDVGYTEAIGVFEYVDERYILAHSFETGAVVKNQTFSVPLVDSVIQYAVNLDFRRIIDSWNFVFVSSHFCINDPKYVLQNDFGVLEMTEYAVTHIDECCLIFDRVARPNKTFGVQRYTECVLFQDAIAKTVNDFQYNHIEHNKEIETRAVAFRAEQREVKEASEIMEKLPVSFHQALITLMEWRGITVEELAEKSLVQPRTIQRMRNVPNYNRKLETVIALCFGLQLHPHISTTLIEKAGYRLTSGEQSVTYSHLLATAYRSTIHEVNEYLEVAGYPRLSGKE